MSAVRKDSQCQTAARIVTDLCRKKSLPRLDVDTCKEFLLFSPDLRVPEPEHFHAISPETWMIQVAQSWKHWLLFKWETSNRNSNGTLECQGCYAEEGNGKPL